MDAEFRGALLRALKEHTERATLGTVVDTSPMINRKIITAAVTMSGEGSPSAACAEEGEHWKQGTSRAKR